MFMSFALEKMSCFELTHDFIFLSFDFLNKRRHPINASIY